MYNQNLCYFDATADMMEFGLIAFASPEFVERFVQQLAKIPSAHGTPRTSNRAHRRAASLPDQSRHTSFPSRSSK